MEPMVKHLPGGTSTMLIENLDVLKKILECMVVHGGTTDLTNGKDHFN